MEATCFSLLSQYQTTFPLYEYATRKHNNYSHLFLKPGKYITFPKTQIHGVVPGIPYMIVKDKINCFQLGAILLPSEHLATSGDIFGCPTLGERVATGCCVEAKGVAKILQFIDSTTEKF